MAESHTHRKARTEKLVFWEKHIAKQGASGLSIKAYCTTNTLSKDAFNYWRKALVASQPSSASTPSSTNSPLFAEVSTNALWVDENSRVGLDREFVLRLPRGGYALSFNRDVDTGTLKALVNLLESMG